MYKKEDDSKGEGNVCRDFLRNVCNRGNRCKYSHPSDGGEDQSTSNSHSNSSNPVFCHDYQNNGCNRPSCKYTHCTREEEEFYNVTKQLPPRVQRTLNMGLGAGNDDLCVSQGDIPVCKDHLKGNCTRGNNCKYRHVHQAEEENMRFPTAPQFPDMMDRMRMRSSMNGRGGDIDFTDNIFEDTMRIKRRRMDVDENWRFELLDEENMMLRHKVETLRQQVSDLKATNEVLLEQNARYRMQKNMMNQAPVRMNQSITTLSSAAPSVAAAVNHLAMGNDMAPNQQVQHVPVGPLGHMPSTGNIGPAEVHAVASMAQNISGLFSRHTGLTASSMALPL